MTYTPKTGAKCSCKRGVQRDNCPTCEGTGWVIDFAAIRANTTRHTPGPLVREIREGLNAITDNAASWTPRQIQEHAQSLVHVASRLEDQRADLLAACREMLERAENAANDIADGNTPGVADSLADGAVALRAAIAKAEGGQS